MIPPLVDAGFRVLVPDLIGFGRRDIAMRAGEIEDLVVYQIGALAGVAAADTALAAYRAPLMNVVRQLTAAARTSRYVSRIIAANASTTWANTHDAATTPTSN